MEKRNILWYETPGTQWIEALPLGNGRMGAMVYGGAEEEKIQIDESSFWSGAASANNNRPGTKDLMEKIREALLQNDFETADNLGKDFVGNKNQYGTNLPTGDLKLKISNIYIDDTRERTEAKYRRYLDLETGIAATEFQIAGKKFKREVFISNPDQVFCMKLTSEIPYDIEVCYEGIGTDVSITKYAENQGKIQGNALETLHSDGKHGVHLEGRIKVKTDGKIIFEHGRICVERAENLELFLDLETDMFLANPGKEAENRVRAAFIKGYGVCRKEHMKDVSRLFQRMEIFLGDEEKRNIPTDKRIEAVKKGKEDKDLYALMYQYGRYLLISSSREDSPLPTHMGGIWNDNIYCNIDCTQDMHIDMNLQMQYWAAALCSLPECYSPFFRYMENVLIPSGRKTAREEYEADGWTAHVVSNPWGFTSLGWAYNWGAWSLGGAWCAVMVWDYYEFTHDREFMENKGFSMIEEAVKFVLDYVFWNEKEGYYMTGPSYSPENHFVINGKDYVLSLSNTCDVILVRELLSVYEKACEEQGKDKNNHLAEKSLKVMKKLPPYKIGKYGQIQEWYYDFDEMDSSHRHTSHLLGMYPFRQINPDNDKELIEGVKRSIERRCRKFEITSWGMNMLLGYYARMHEGEAALKIIQWIFQKIVRCNMASVMDDEKSMWKGTWELDGNTGFTASMSELLVQSTEEEVWILPALPKAWKDGYIKGISLKNGGKANIFWKYGKLSKVELYIKKGGTLKIRYEKLIKEVVVKPESRLVAIGGLECINSL